MGSVGGLLRQGAHRTQNELLYSGQQQQAIPSTCDDPDSPGNELET